MTNESPPFDQGVFLLHLNKGKEALASKEYEMARLELELALRYRPDNEDVLNLLGLLYFKLRRYPQAEEIYGKLLEKNPNVFILHSNLGLIQYKQGKIDEAIEHLEKATTLNPSYTKAHLYLGMAYRRKKKYGLALEHFRHAGAEEYAKEMEEKLQEIPRTMGKQEKTVANEAKPTQEATVPEISRTQPITIEEDQSTSIPPKDTTQPVKEMTLAFTRDTEEVLASPKITKPEEKEVGAPHFILHRNGFLEIHTTSTVYIRKGTLTTYVGNFQFRPVPGVAGTTASTLVEARGQGKLFLYEKGKQTYLMDLHHEFLYVEGSHLLALEESIKVRAEPILPLPTPVPDISIFKVHGKGSIALLADAEPLVLRVSPEYPLTIRVKALMAWSGHLLISPVEEEASSSDSLVRFEGNGFVVAFHA